MLEPKAVGAAFSLQVWGSIQSQGLNRGPAGTRHATLTLELSPWPISNLQSYFSSIEQPSQAWQAPGHCRSECRHQPIQRLQGLPGEEATASFVLC